jgi:DNA-binding MarR family transcriptional regulator
LRAFRVYFDVLATADWFRTEMRGQLETFDMTMMDFRAMELLLREGPTHIRAAARKLQVFPQNFRLVVRRLERRKWVRRKRFRLPAADNRWNRWRRRGGEEVVGLRVAKLQLTREGKRFISGVLPKHAKVVKALMRALDGREQEAISRYLKKLREGDVLKFMKEMRVFRYGEGLGVAGDHELVASDK